MRLTQKRLRHIALMAAAITCLTLTEPRWASAACGVDGLRTACPAFAVVQAPAASASAAASAPTSGRER